MMVAVRAIYENGNLRLLDPVDLQPGQQVVINVERDTRSETKRDLTPEEELEILKTTLGDLIIWADPTYDENAWVEDEAENIARELGKGKWLSEIIIEERHEP